MIGQKGAPATYGGVERHVEELASQLVRRGHSVTVYTRPHYTPRTTTTWRGIRLVSLPSIRTKHLDAISHTVLASFHAAWRGYDIIHYHGVGPSLVAWLPRLLGSRARIVVTFHSLDRQHEKWGGFARAMLRIGEWTALTFPHRTIAVSQTIRQYCRSMYNHDTMYIPNGVRSTRPTTSFRPSILRHFDLTPNHYVLSVSRLIQHKNIDILIKAFRRLPTQNKLVIVGSGFHTDAYVQKLHEMAGDDPRIIFTGFQSGKDVANLFAHARLFVSPSRSEGMPIALLEAASYGLGILASDIKPHREVLTNTKPAIGFLFRNNSLTDLQKMLGSLIRHPRQAQRSGLRAQDRMALHFNWLTIAEQTEALYVSELTPSRSTRLVLAQKEG